MLEAIPTRLWEKPLDFNLWATDQGELQIPFSRYIHQTQPTCLSSVNLPRFSELPKELQLRIFYFCDNPTLFQLMQTSSYVRSETSKLFFSGPDAWYCVDADWIHRGCYPGDTRHDMEFLPLIKQLEVQFSEKDDPILRPGKELLEERFQDFWQRLHTHFPRAVRVILCKNDTRTSGELPPEAFKKLAQMCVPGIEVSLSFLKARNSRYDRVLERSIWQNFNSDPNTSVISEWSEIPAQLHPRIILPNRIFRGPIGAYEYYIHKSARCYYPQQTLSVMLITSMERHHFHGRHVPFQCPAPDCAATFTRPGDFTAHVIEEWPHFEHIVPPAPFKAVFAEQQNEIGRLGRDWNTAVLALAEMWGGSETERRSATIRAAIEQIEQDPLYAQGKAAGESRAFKEALDMVEAIF